MPADIPARLLPAEEYLRMCEIGIIDPDERLELLEGEIVPIPIHGPWHGGVIAWLNEAFADRRNDRSVTSIQNAFLASEHDVPVPDLAILERGRYMRAYPQAKDTFLLIEVAVASVHQDRFRKSRIYARAGIPEYWIVIEPESLIEVFRAPVAGKYTENFQVRPGDPLSPEAFPDVQLDTADLFAE